MKIAVTGANGYIGRHVVKALLDTGHDVLACDITLEGIDKRATMLCSNVLDQNNKDFFEQIVNFDVCLHLAWRDGFIHSSDAHLGDLSFHYLFLSSLIKNGLKHLAVMGTMHEVGYYEGAIDEDTPCNPISMYGIAKDSLRRSMFLKTKENKFTLQWLRGFYIYGDDLRNHSIFAKLSLAAKDGKKSFPFTSGRNKYDFISIDLLARQIAASITQDKTNGIINCCSGKPVTLAEQVEKYIKENKLKIKLEYGVYPDRPYDSPCIYGNADKIQNILRG